MTLTPDDQYNGKCPVCRAQLLEADGFLTCVKMPEHFKIKTKLFEAAWEKFDAGTMKRTALLKVLLGGNEAEYKPTPEQVLEREALDETDG